MKLSLPPGPLAPLLAAGLVLTGCNDAVVPGDGTTGEGTLGGLAEGRALFGDGTFGTEGYWTDAVRLGPGLVDGGVTLLDLLRLGLQLDAGEDPALAATVAVELATDLSPAAAPTLHDPAALEDALANGAVLGLVAADRDGDGRVELAGADTLGVSCALCHGSVDGALYGGDLAGVPGAVGGRVDGVPAAGLDLGGLFALADNSRALVPYLAQPLSTVGGLVIGGGGRFVDGSSTEAEVDAVLRDPAAVPPGTWDLLPDGVGAPVVLPALFDLRRDAPYGAAGAFRLPPDVVNAHLTLGLDPTTLLTVDGTVVLDRLAPGVAGEVRANLEQVLLATGVPTPPGGFPFVDARPTGVRGTAASPVGLRVAEPLLGRVTGYLSSLVPPPAPAGDPLARLRGESVYLAACASCHGTPGGAEPLAEVPLAQLLVPYAPTTLLARGFPYTDLGDDRQRSFDDRFVVFDRVFSPQQVPAPFRTVPTPRLDALHLAERLLHDGSVRGLGALLDPARGADAPHPVYLDGPARADVVEYLTRD